MPHHIALRVALAYVLGAALWILISDQVLDQLVAATPLSLSVWQSIKGLLFVTVTGGLLFALLKRLMTKQQTVTRALREREELLSSINQNVSEGLFRSTLDGKLVYANRAFVEMYGFESLAEMRDRKAVDSYKNPEDRKRYLETLEEEGEVSGYEMEFKRKDGSTFWGLGSARVVYDEEGKPKYHDGAIVDITDRKLAERELINAKETAEEMSRLKDAFLANMSHEIRTPLTSIIGFADVLYEKAAPENQKFARLIRRSGDRLMDTLNSVLDLARLESQRRTLDEPQTVAIVEHVQETLDLFRPEARAKNLTLRLRAEDHPSATLDVSALNRVLSNLISNAIKFTSEGSITVTVECENLYTRISVEDTGIGISDDFLPHAFDDFKQESQGTARSFEGSGLGLAITKRLVNLMGGTIQVESTKGEGTRFIIRLPQEAEYRSDAPDEPRE